MSKFALDLKNKEIRILEKELRAEKRKLAKAKKALRDIYVHVHCELPVESENMGNRLQWISCAVVTALDHKGIPKVRQGKYAGPKITFFEELERIKTERLSHQLTLGNRTL